MGIKFYKYQGTGNDFVIIDNREGKVHLNNIALLCHRRFGIGADGLMLLENADGFDFKMVYYNSDGRESSMCGNGGRCLALFAHSLGIGNQNKLKFIAIDGPHEAEILENNMVKLKMGDVDAIKKIDADFELNTGSPHYVKFIENTQNLSIINEAQKIRNSEKYIKEGINVNFVQVLGENNLAVRTYERGVEDETYSCGTGVTACALALSELEQFKMGSHDVQLQTPGGQLSVSFTKSNSSYNNIWLCGPAMRVFEGEISEFV